jgi:hypothetical protein
VFAAILAAILMIAFVFFVVYGRDMIAVTKTVNQFMTAMGNGEIETAHSLFSTRTKAVFPITKLQQALEENPLAYTGFEKMGCSGIQFDPYYPGRDTLDPPLGKSARMDGCIIYKDGYDDKLGGLTAFLEKEENGWRILYINPAFRGKK